MIQAIKNYNDNLAKLNAETEALIDALVVTMLEGL
jgi:hypothetical protein